MSTIDFIKVFRSLITIKELQNFLSRHNTIKIAINEQYRHLIVKFFENIKIIDLENVIFNLF